MQSTLVEFYIKYIENLIINKIIEQEQHFNINSSQILIAPKAYSNILFKLNILFDSLNLNREIKTILFFHYANAFKNKCVLCQNSF